MDDDLMTLALAGSTDEDAPAEEGDEFVGGDAELDGYLADAVGDDPRKKEALYNAIKRCKELGADEAEPDEDDNAEY